MATELLTAISPLFIALIGLGLIAGAISGKKAFRFLGGLFLLLLMIPLRDEILRVLPLWLWVPIVAVLAIRSFVTVLTFLFGRGIAEDTTSALLADALSGLSRVFLRMLAAPFRIIANAIRSRAQIERR